MCEWYVVCDEDYELVELYLHKYYHGLLWTVMPVNYLNQFVGSFA